VIHPDGTLSQACEFAVCDLGLRPPDDQVRLGEPWQVEVETENIEPVAAYLYNEGYSYGRHPLFLSEQDRRRGRFAIPVELLRKP
jgi:hypothetical protein